MPTQRPFRRLGIGHKLTLGFGVLAAVTLLVVALGFVAGQNATQVINLTEAIRVPAALTSSQAQASLLRMQLHVRGYLVLGDSQDMEQYHLAQQSFEKSLAALQAMSATWPEDEARTWVTDLTATYAEWVQLPPRLFALHDNTLLNRPALRLARVDVQALRVRILEQIDAMIAAERALGASPPSDTIIENLVAFQTSLDAMATNLMAYGASGELNFKLGYGPQLATNAALWNTLSAARHRLSADQQDRLDMIGRDRVVISDLALRIITIWNSDHAFEDIYIYRTEFVPMAEHLLDILLTVTAYQQQELQNDLTMARHGLANARFETVAGGLLAVVFSVALAALFRRSIVAPVRRLTGVAERVASGDLAARAHVESSDEIGVLATSINIMTQRLTQTIENLETLFAEVQRAKDAAESASRAKSIFLASMSHELRTPLNGILGYAQILRRDKSLAERQRAGLDVIQQSGEHLLTLINDILDLARIEAGKLELYPKDVPLAPFLQAIVEIVRVKALEKDLGFVCEAAPDLPRWIRADDKRLRQVLLNLLSNAVKFTDRGEVRLRVAYAPPGRLHIEVEDSGIGIADDLLEAIFQPFEQVGETQRRLGGAGLGLAISRQYVQLMGGDIRVESHLGQGSRFWFDLDAPVVEADRTPASPEWVVTGYEGQRKKVLVVDDLVENRAILIDMLNQLGFDLVEAKDGREGVEKAESLEPDLILMDVVMPGVDGLEATRRLRRLPRLQDVPIIAVSASASGRDKDASLAAGADAFLAKPVEFGKLFLQMAALLGLRWTYEVPEGAAMQDSHADGALILPPRQQMEILLHLAQEGYMRNVLQYADGLIALDTRYRPFADQLRQLAQGYDTQALLALVEGSLFRKASP